MWEYTDAVREHFLNPRNAGELADANAVGEVGSLACGDALKLFLKINDQGVIRRRLLPDFRLRQRYCLQFRPYRAYQGQDRGGGVQADQ